MRWRQHIAPAAGRVCSAPNSKAFDVLAGKLGRQAGEAACCTPARVLQDLVLQLVAGRFAWVAAAAALLAPGRLPVGRDCGLIEHSVQQAAAGGSVCATSKTPLAFHGGLYKVKKSSAPCEARTTRRIMATGRSKTPALPAVHFSSLLFVCALLPALLFKGPQIEFFAVAQIVLMIWLGWVAWRACERGIVLPRTALALALTLFWAWLALSLLWSEAPSISVINFWWVGSMVLVFWLFTLTPDRDLLWSHSAAILLLLGLVLALMGIYDALVFERQARAVFETRNTQAAFLNLIVLPASAYFLRLMAEQTPARHYAGWLGAVLYVMFFSIFLTASRGAFLSLAIALAILLALSARSASRRGIVLLLALIAAAFLSTNLAHGGGELERRLAELTHDAARRYIWESSWQMLQAAPWHGIGLGLYYLAYPPYRNPLDDTAGFFAHNDYLQIWIEVGWPGLALLLAVLAAVLWTFVRLMRRAGVAPAVRLEAAGLFCGLLAVAGHSLVDFNFYVLSISMTAGLMLGRLQELAGRALNTATIRLRRPRLIGKQVYPLIVSLLVLLPVSYFAALGMANSYYDKALKQASEGRLQEADASLAAAERLTPSDDRIPIARADLYRHAISLLPASDQAERQSLYDAALAFLDRAERLNALRSLSYVVRARLYAQNPALAGAQAYALAAGAYRQALAHNPRLFQARTEYANLLLAHGEKQAALEVLEQGEKYWYYSGPELIPFYRLTAQLRSAAGRTAAALALQDKIAALQAQMQSSYSFRGY
jgi:O-antigen ligase